MHLPTIRTDDSVAKNFGKRLEHTKALQNLSHIPCILDDLHQFKVLRRIDCCITTRGG